MFLQRANGKQLLALLKWAARGNEQGLVIPVGMPILAVLRVVATQKDQLSSRDVIDLTEWRNRFVTRFLTEFEATPERTASWLERAVGPNPCKVLFMVDLLDGSTVGHVGIGFIDWEQGYAEADAIVRGRDTPRGLMRMALEAAMRWAREQLQMTSIGVRVRSDNPALGFYSKMGFSETARVPLRRIYDQEMISWVEDDSLSKVDVSLVHMIHDAGQQPL
jgi:RimJ/RimL family protein N-acetyltransferase